MCNFYSSGDTQAVNREESKLVSFKVWYIKKNAMGRSKIDEGKGVASAGGGGVAVWGRCHLFFFFF